MRRQDTAEVLLDVEDLTVAYDVGPGRPPLQIVHGASFRIDRGELVAIVGESGSGKTTMVQSLIRLNPQDRCHVGGHARFEGIDLVAASERALGNIRCGRIGMIFQDPYNALNPVITLGKQMDEALARHTSLSKDERRARTIELFEMVRLPDPSSLLRVYPHQVSGGMRQRVCIAMALSGGAELLLADEPTTALDVTTQHQIIVELNHLRRQTGLAVALVTHNLALVANIADRILVMYGGRIVEEGTRDDIFFRPRHPYTQGLLAAIPRLDAEKDADLAQIPGEPPQPGELSIGCGFAPRCQVALARCSTDRPPAGQVAEGHRCACWVALEAVESAPV